MNFRSKMWAIPAAAACLLGLGLVVTTVLGWRTSSQLEQLQRASYPYLEQISRIDRALDNMRASLQSAAMEGDADKLGEAKAHAERIEAALAAAAALAGHEAQASALRQAFTEYKNAGMATVAALLAKQPADDKLKLMQATQKQLVASLKEQDDAARATVNQGFVEVAASRTRSDWVNIAVALAAMLGLGLAARGVVASVWRDLGGEPAVLRDRVQRVAAGDLTTDIRVDANDRGSLNAAVASMTQRLRDAVSQIRGASDSISTASGEIAAGNQDLSARTEDTASNLQRASSELEQITGSVRHSAEAAQQANQLAAEAATAAQRGGEIVSSVVDSMSGISQASGKIGEIIGVIDGIAFQTNILALNAAVEAARAGEQGRGFAVVAGEVRTLAQRSAQAAREIKTLIQTSGEKVQSGTRLVTDAGQAMAEIVAGVRRVSDIIGEINTAMTQQSSGIEQVNRAVSELEQMTQQNAALVEQSAAAAQSMNTQASELVGSVSAFRLEAIAAA
ncbi:MAG TPA: methyl-accepting chemotaxis protein [Burkholderiaceae bacterium]|nr:methyl-accepting chemotaxis protein [Burkholderiaceae bacterium]